MKQITDEKRQEILRHAKASDNPMRPEMHHSSKLEEYLANTE